MPVSRSADLEPTAVNSVDRMPLRVTCWGTRGSIPSPGRATARFGGNTSCLEVRTDDDRCFIFDAGTGIRVLGRRLDALEGSTNADLFLTHFHWDHIQGVPFFGPLYRPETRIRIHGPRQGDTDIETLFRGQMGSVYFPVPYEALSATLEFIHLDDEPWIDGNVEVSAIRTRHPSRTYGYRIRSGTAALAYIPDNELVGGSYELGGDVWYRELVEFLDGVDVLFHDAMYTDQEYPTVEGWGHSTFSQAVRLAEDAGVRRLYAFHHAPERTDTELLELAARLRDDLVSRGSPLQLAIATEGEELLVQGR